MKLTDEQRAAYSAAVAKRRGRAPQDDEAMFAAGIAHAQAWRPMDSAPKDGTKVLAWDALATAMIPVEWDAVEQDWMTCWTGVTNPDCTHWLPLPPAPEGWK